MKELNYYIRKIQAMEYSGDWKDHFAHWYKNIYDLISHSGSVKSNDYLTKMEQLKETLLDVPYISGGDSKLRFRKTQKNIVDLLYKITEENKKVYISYGGEMSGKVVTFLGKLRQDFEVLENDQEFSIKDFRNKAEDCDFAILDLTAKDISISMLELGYFLSSTGPKDIVVLTRDETNINLLKDISKSFLIIDDSSNWKPLLCDKMIKRGIYLDQEKIDAILNKK